MSVQRALGHKRPSEEDCNGGCEARDMLACCVIGIVDSVGALQDSALADVLGQLGVVAASRLLGDGQALKWVRFHAAGEAPHG